ncbi:hypothetical protein V491_08935 [Pseudogymnoascus sp. VKM F-3775]|nr:hypothetical protein V491_08935 [Pseudogymnoascus sp. VKM F-3775]
MFSSMSPAPTAPTPQPAGVLPCYSKNDLNVTLQVQRNAEGVVLVTARFANASFTDSKSGVGLQAAVPKTQKLALNAITSAELGPGQEATQTVAVEVEDFVYHASFGEFGRAGGLVGAEVK